MSKYENPPNTQEFIDRFMTLTDKKEIQNFIEDTFPGWLIASTTRYCHDYPHLQLNWETICRLNNVKPQKIVVVDEVHFDRKEHAHNHSLLMLICDVMTKLGYVVRRKEEFTGCESCQRAIPTALVWHLMQEKGMPVPLIWSTTCSGCTAPESEDISKKL